MIPNQHTPEYTAADLRRVAESCVAAMKRYRGDFTRDDWSPAVAALEAAKSQPAPQAARTMLAAVQRLEQRLAFAAESTGCRLDTAYAGIALDACMEAVASMRNGNW